ncbi:MAG: class I SAM-dependent methyltransferase [Candidatus Curtissbacteria bacterium]|nr:class I SAM-dependent methyltransferase [Candidatus Curtissbacteria bacterium]
MAQSLYDLLRSWMLPLKEIDRLIPRKGRIVDLGCGEGVTAKYLAHIKSRTIIGVDNNKKRLQKSTLKNLQFKLADIRKYPLKKADTVIFSDVLHHLSYVDQKVLLAKVAKALKKNRLLLIKEIDTKEFVRSSLSRFWDFVFYPKDKIYYHDSEKFKTELEKLGFIVEVIRASRLFPGSTTLFVCQKS